MQFENDWSRFRIVFSEYNNECIVTWNIDRARFYKYGHNSKKKYSIDYFIERGEIKGKKKNNLNRNKQSIEGKKNCNSKCQLLVRGSESGQKGCMENVRYQSEKKYEFITLRNILLKMTGKRECAHEKRAFYDVNIKFTTAMTTTTAKNNRFYGMRPQNTSRQTSGVQSHNVSYSTCTHEMCIL